MLCFLRFCANKADLHEKKPKFVHRIDDDSQLDFELLSSRLEAVVSEEDEGDGKAVVFCPTVQRNQPMWRHRDSPILGKWANVEYQGSIETKKPSNTMKYSKILPFGLTKISKAYLLNCGCMHLTFVKKPN